MMCEGYDRVGGAFVEALNPAGAKQATEMPTGVGVAAVPSQMGPFRCVMQEMPLPECVCAAHKNN